MVADRRPFPEPIKVLIVNLHSTDNLGDEGIQAVTFAGLEQVFPGAIITIAADDPESWRRYRQLTITGSLCTWVGDCAQGKWRRGLWQMPLVIGFLAIASMIYRLTGWGLQMRKKEQRALLTAYYEADLVLTCGGGYFYAHHSPSPGFFWALMAIAFPLALGKPVAMLPQSVGPIIGRWQQALARHTFSRVPLVMLRESLSVRFLHDVLGIKKPLHVLPDLAFGLVSVKTISQSEGNTSSELHVGLTIVDRATQTKDFDKQVTYELALIQTLTALHETAGVSLHLFVQCYGPSAAQDDRTVTERLHRQLSEQGIPVHLHASFQDYQAIRGALATMDLLIATRMHSGIFALSAGVPVVMIAYQPKARGIMTAFGLDDYCLDISTVTPPALLAVTHHALENRVALRQQIMAQLSRIRPELERWQLLLAGEAWRK